MMASVSNTESEPHLFGTSETQPSDMDNILGGLGKQPSPGQYNSDIENDQQHTSGDGGQSRRGNGSYYFTLTMAKNTCTTETTTLGENSTCTSSR